MSDSDRKPKRTWPNQERRAREERRTIPERRRRRRPPRGEEVERYNPANRRKSQRRSARDRRDETLWKPVPLELEAGADLGVEEVLVAAATDARTRARAQYSGFQVGAALETGDGAVVTGCNVENASFGLTLCAERVALVKALSDGHAVFTRVAVVADAVAPTPPCGPCRQLLWEYCGDIEVILANLDGITARHRLSALFPEPFDRRSLGRTKQGKPLNP